MQKKTVKQLPHLRIRIDPKLIARLEKARETNGNTLTGEIVTRLEQSFVTADVVALARKMSDQAEDQPKTLSVAEAGKLYFGLSRNASYDAAKRGDIPTIKIGPKILRVSVRALERMLDGPKPSNEA